jgi:hypothetical protein
VPQAIFAAVPPWSFRGANLCAWELGLRTKLKIREVAIDPVIGRLAIGVTSLAEATALVDALLLTYTYGSPGPVGAHPISRPPATKQFNGEPVQPKVVNFHQNPNGLRDALDGIQNSALPILIEIEDSMTHDLDLAVLTGIKNEAGGPNLQLNRSLIIRATNGNRPVIRLANPLRFRPTNVAGATSAQQQQFDAVMDHLTVHLEGLYITRAAGVFPAGAPLIARAALNSLEVVGCTLDPGGFRKLDGTRAPIATAMGLAEDYGFVAANEIAAFRQTPEIHLERSIAGPLHIDAPYTLFLNDSIIDAGKSTGEDGSTTFAVTALLNPATDWGPPTQVSGITVFGRTRVTSMTGHGGIWVHALEVLNNQKGCIKYSYFSGAGDRLPQNFACVKGSDADLRFTTSIFGQPAYAQPSLIADRRIRERGPGDDEMGAYGFLLEAHKWRNLQIRFREFMPAGVRPLLLPVT